jgi:hypothetical protein
VLGAVTHTIQGVQSESLWERHSKHRVSDDLAIKGCIEMSQNRYTGDKLQKNGFRNYRIKRANPRTESIFLLERARMKFNETVHWYFGVVTCDARMNVYRYSNAMLVGTWKCE